MKLGVMVELDENLDLKIAQMKELGFSTCQLCSWNIELFTDRYAQIVNEAVKKHEVEITAFWCGYPGPAVWNFYDGPQTLGLVPPAYRFERIEALKTGADFALKIGVKDVVTHVGFIPENPVDPEYLGVVNAVRYVAEHCKRNGQYFLFETGQETPVTLKRIIQDVGLDNLGINLDPANLLLYGRANPVDALDVFGEYVRGVHAKDGQYPTDGRNLGEEKPLGQGRVNFPLLIERLKQLSYKGTITIEREISGEQQIKDIQDAKEMLEKLIL